MKTQSIRTARMTPNAAKRDVESKLCAAGLEHLPVTATVIAVGDARAVLVLVKVERGDVPAAPCELFDILTNNPGPRAGGYSIALW